MHFSLELAKLKKKQNFGQERYTMAEKKVYLAHWAKSDKNRQENRKKFQHPYFHKKTNQAVSIMNIDVYGYGKNYKTYDISSISV